MTNFHKDFIKLRFKLGITFLTKREAQYYSELKWQIIVDFLDTLLDQRTVFRYIERKDQRVGSYLDHLIEDQIPFISDLKWKCAYCQKYARQRWKTIKKSKNKVEKEVINDCSKCPLVKNHHGSCLSSPILSTVSSFLSVSPSLLGNTFEKFFYTGTDTNSDMMLLGLRNTARTVLYEIKNEPSPHIRGLNPETVQEKHIRLVQDQVNERSKKEEEEKRKQQIVI